MGCPFDPWPSTEGLIGEKQPFFEILDGIGGRKTLKWCPEEDST